MEREKSGVERRGRLVEWRGVEREMSIERSGEEREVNGMERSGEGDSGPYFIRGYRGYSLGRQLDRGGTFKCTQKGKISEKIKK